MRIVACGDALFSCRNLKARVDKTIQQEFARADATFANAEFACPRRETPPIPRRFATAVDAFALDELAALGINLFSAANNHSGDHGHQGVLDTIEAFEERGLVYAGIGRSLDEARAAQFLDTDNGRVALIAASSTKAAEFAASAAGKGIPARAGLNPLRWGRAYVLPEAEYRQMQRIDEMLGTAAAAAEMRKVEVWGEESPNTFQFGSMFETALRIERGDSADVRYVFNKKDAQAIMKSIRDAKHRADVVVVSLHFHEGLRENWYSAEPAGFVEDFAREAIDAGASAFFGHGAHMLRGIEIRKGCPIFYSLGSLVMEFEMGGQKMTPEGYEAFGLPPDSLPSDLHVGRLRNDKGELQGFYGDPRFSRGCAARCDFGDGQTTVDLVPIHLGLDRNRATQRGFPMRANAAQAQEILDSLAQMSRRYGTKFALNKDDLTIKVTAG